MSGADMNWILPDIPRVYTALAEWLACFICIMEMKKRLTGKLLAFVSAGMLGIQSVFLYMTDGLEGAGWILCMAAAVGLMYIYLFICCDISKGTAAHFLIRAFVTAEFAASLEWQVDCFFRYELGWESMWHRVLWLVVIYGAFYIIIWLLDIKFLQGSEEFEVTKQELIPYIIIGLAVFLMSNLSFVFSRTPFSGLYMPEIYNIRTTVDLGGLAVLYAYHVQWINLRIRYKMESLENFMHNQYVQYQQSQEVIDIVNYKYHDLKHYLAALRSGDLDKEGDSLLDRLEEEISSYETQNKTGNQVLDTLLTSKSMTCMKNHIEMTSVVDGTLFRFMDTMDICSIFGNALDNAIECAKKLPEEKRLIHVSAVAKKSFLIIRFENYCEDKLQFSEDLPKTTKDNVRLHGYGLRSLKYTVHKCGGEVDISTEDNWFRLKILIPLQI